MKKALVSVVMITYGHENFIEQAINGVLMQQCDFDIELIIVNDCSPDKTDSVVKKIIENNPKASWFKYLKHEENIGMTHNFIYALKEAKGKYIAICEGDDYWTDPLKLQKQVNFLEGNNDFVLCFTDRDILVNGKIEVNLPLYTKSNFNKSEIAYIHVPTLTAVFRNVVSEIPTKLNNNLIDASLFLFLSQYGSFNYINKTTSVYRVHCGGAYSGNSDVVNYTRSTKARLAAWFYLKKVDKISLTYVLQNFIQLKKVSELRERKYWSAFKSIGLEIFFKTYVFLFLLKKKIKNQHN